MSSRTTSGTKRPAHFDPEERESPKRPRQLDQNSNQRGHRDQRERNTTNGAERRDRNGTYGGDRDRRPGRDEARPYSREDRGERPRDTQRRTPPRRQRSRDRSQDRGKGADSRPPRTNGTSASSAKVTEKDSKAGIKKEVAIKDDPVKMEVDDVDDDDQEMMRAMGFAKFKTTKNTKVPGNDKLYAVRKEKQMTARQYMNRPGGFNRPLSPSAGAQT